MKTVIDGDIFSIPDLETTKMTADDEPFLLPSQRKQMMNQGNKQTKGNAKKKGGGNNNDKRKKRPAKQPKMTIDQILNDSSLGFESDGAFVISSDKISPPPSPKREEKPFVEEVKPQKLPEAAKSKFSSANPIQTLESSIIGYITNAVASVKRTFTDELKLLLDNSKNEESIINAFVFGLPSEVEKAASEEIELATSDNFFGKQSLLKAMDVQLEAFNRSIPGKNKSGSTATIETFESIASTVFNQKTQMIDLFENSIDDFQREKGNLTNARQSYCLAKEQNQLKSFALMRKIEAESASKRLDVDQQFFDFKKKMFEERSQDWKDKQLASQKNGTSEDEVLSKLAQLSKQVPKSKYQTALFNINTLTENIKRGVHDVQETQKQAMFELESFKFNVCVNRNRQSNENGPLKTSKKQNIMYNDVAMDVKGKLNTVRKKRELLLFK